MRRIILAGLALLGVFNCVHAPPPATQAERLLPVHFINVDSRGNRIVFICDIGGLMTIFDPLRGEMQKTIEGLRPPQCFNVVFCDRGTQVTPISKNLLEASPQNKQEVYDYLNRLSPYANYDPESAIRGAYAMHPDVIFVVGDLNGSGDLARFVELFKRLNADGKCRVNTFAFSDEGADPKDVAMLKQIAEDSKGTFSVVSEKDFGK